MGLFSFLFGRKKPRQIKLGIALGSGGAKGFAELGVLKAFEENEIFFDIIGGTSIGSIVGAFLADGYSSTDIMELLKAVNVSEIKNTFMLGMDTFGMKGVIDREIGNKNIEELKKPFVCIATEMESGEERAFRSGNIADALCASGCIPPFFKPVVIDGEKLVDGAFSNSIPADHVRAMGADYVVGIDLSTHESKSGGLLSKLLPTYKGVVEEPWAKGYLNSDVVLHPDLTGFKSVSFGRAEEMFDIGYQTALEHIPKIKADIEVLKLGKVKNKTKSK